MSKWRCIQHKRPKHEQKVYVSTKPSFQEVHEASVYICPEYGNVIFMDSDCERIFCTHWRPRMSKERQIVLMLIRHERELLKEFDHEDFGVAARCEHAAISLARKEAQRILSGE